MSAKHKGLPNKKERIESILRERNLGRTKETIQETFYKELEVGIKAEKGVKLLLITSKNIPYLEKEDEPKGVEDKSQPIQKEV